MDGGLELWLYLRDGFGMLWIAMQMDLVLREEERKAKWSEVKSLV